MDIQSNTQITLTITLTGDEARHILVDPAKFQADLRESLRTHNGHSGQALSLGRRKNGGG